MSTHRSARALCTLGIALGMTSFVYFGFLTNARVGDTNCYAVLWQRNGRSICDESNLRREVLLVASTFLVVGSAVGVRRTTRRTGPA